MSRRGEPLREHILWVAKDVFLEVGFERASMDEVASRAETSKRTLYAHFASKEKLFLEVIGLVRGLFLTRLKQPVDYSDQPVEAVAMFCARYLESMLYGPSVRMCRLSMAESERFPEQAVEYFAVLFAEVQARLSAYLAEAWRMPASAGEAAAQKLLGQVLFPRFPRALLGVDALAENFADEGTPLLHLGPIREAVLLLLGEAAVRQA